MSGPLAALRFPVERSRGRRYGEPAHPYRNEFQRDRDRIVHARAFRRLEDKTQVFTAPLSDHFRNRLTHTIEVAQIARTVAVALGLDEQLTEALALAHDIGHPPFGHAGERELNRQMARFGERFDHNLHALRIVESFEQRYARFPGLNLTFEVREGIVKHSADISGEAAGELAEYLPELRPPLEAQVIDPADEIAYNTADLDDGFAARFFEAADIAGGVPQYAEIYATAETQFPGAPERILFHESLRALIDLLVGGLITGTVEAAAGAGAADADGVRRVACRLARFSPAAAATNAGLKEFLRRKVYYTGVLVEERRRSAAMIAALFGFFLERPESLPPPYAEQAQAGAPHRVVCDYIAGMTDGFLRRTYEHLLG